MHTLYSLCIHNLVNSFLTKCPWLEMTANKQTKSITAKAKLCKIVKNQNEALIIDTNLSVVKMP